MKDYSFKKNKDTKDLTEYEVTIEYKSFLLEKDNVFESLASEVVIPGFRPGKGPKDAIEANLGSKLLNKAISSLLPRVTYDIIVSEGLNPVTNPEYDILDLDSQKGIVYKFTFTNYPEIKLGDYSKITVKKEDPKVTDKEVEEVIKNVVRTSLPAEEISTLREPQGDNKTSKTKDPKNSKEAEGQKQVQDFDLTDELVAKLGYEKEKTLKDVKESVFKKLTELKAQQVEDDYANKVVEEAVKLTKIDLPSVFVEREVHNMEHSFIDRIKELNLDVDTYLSTQGSTLEDKKKEWTKDATNRIIADMTLLTIAKENNVLPTDKDVEDEIKKIENDSMRATYQTEDGKDYVRTVMTKQRGLSKLLEILENKTTKSSKKKVSN